MKRFNVICWGDPEDGTWDIVDVTNVTDGEWEEAAREDAAGDRPWIAAVLLAPSLVVLRPTFLKYPDGSWNLLTFEQFKIKAAPDVCPTSDLPGSRHYFVFFDFFDSLDERCRYCKQRQEEIAADREARMVAAGKITREVNP